MSAHASHARAGLFAASAKGKNKFVGSVHHVGAELRDKNISSYPHAPGVKNAARAPQRVAWKATLNKLAVGQEGALQLYGTVLLRMAAVQVMD